VKAARAMPDPPTGPGREVFACRGCDESYDADGSASCLCENSDGTLSGGYELPVDAGAAPATWRNYTSVEEGMTGVGTEARQLGHDCTADCGPWLQLELPGEP
jgi:hypothetical protein